MRPINVENLDAMMNVNSVVMQIRRSNGKRNRSSILSSGHRYCHYGGVMVVIMKRITTLYLTCM